MVKSLNYKRLNQNNLKRSWKIRHKKCIICESLDATVGVKYRANIILLYSINVKKYFRVHLICMTGIVWVKITSNYVD